MTRPAATALSSSEVLQEIPRSQENIISWAPVLVVDQEAAKIPQHNHDMTKMLCGVTPPKRRPKKQQLPCLYASNKNSGGAEVYTFLILSKKLSSDSQYFAKCTTTLT